MYISHDMNIGNSFCYHYTVIHEYVFYTRNNKVTQCIKKTDIGHI